MQCHLCFADLVFVYFNLFLFFFGIFPSGFEFSHKVIAQGFKVSNRCGFFFNRNYYRISFFLFFLSYFFTVTPAIVKEFFQFFINGFFFNCFNFNRCYFESGFLRCQFSFQRCVFSFQFSNACFQCFNFGRFNHCNFFFNFFNYYRSNFFLCFFFAEEGGSNL